MNFMSRLTGVSIVDIGWLSYRISQKSVRSVIKHTYPMTTGAIVARPIMVSIDRTTPQVNLKHYTCWQNVPRQTGD